MDVLVMVLPLLGGLAGMALQFAFSRLGESHKQLQERQHSAYVDYLRAIAQSSHLRSDQDLRDASLLAAEAKSRIAVYGEKKVVMALAKFERNGPVLDNPGSVAAFLELAASMRVGDAVDEDALELIMLGPPRRARVEPPGEESEAEPVSRANRKSQRSKKTRAR